jgi:TRAP-type C4-dicarboxylate transport system substrate-binding protein
MTVPPAVRGTLLLVAVFVAGVSAGILYERQQNHRHESVSADAHSLLHRLATELELSPAQQNAIDQILARHQRDVDLTWHEMQPRVHAALDAAEQEIVTILTPEQAARFRQLTRTHHPPGQHQ